MSNPSSTPLTPTLTLTIEFTGGLEMLFSNIPSHTISVPAKNDSGSNLTVGDLIPWLCEHLMKDSRKELFVLDGGVRPGILVLINEADWELEGEDKYELKDGDNVLFVSTLHGG
ncbi:Ubiquitin- modifier 1 [Knufia obscura]|uniref:Ubiquitin-related modifier 1 n=2 Tax=Knufia TaxID=430999 RepID=A0AAN8EQT4_9EURO|nr:Ubiquitin- modifier 1 [Knufia obscura]KAK5953985.1 Ubiquitin- modifier 1 [Knufia fluminis]